MTDAVIRVPRTPPAVVAPTALLQSAENGLAVRVLAGNREVPDVQVEDTPEFRKLGEDTPEFRKLGEGEAGGGSGREKARQGSCLCHKSLMIKEKGMLHAEDLPHGGAREGGWTHRSWGGGVHPRPMRPTVHPKLSGRMLLRVGTMARIEVRGSSSRASTTRNPSFGRTPWPVSDFWFIKGVRNALFTCQCRSLPGFSNSTWLLRSLKGFR